MIDRAALQHQAVQPPSLTSASRLAMQRRWAQSGPDRPWHTDQEQVAVQRSAVGNATSAAVPLSLPATGGVSLPLELRRTMEERLGTDFSGVRIHSDSAAGSAALRLGARAFTHGQDVYFAAGYYQPGSNAGRGLLAHELTHVVQQRNGRFPVRSSASRPARDRSRLEAEADRVGRSVQSSSLPVKVEGEAAGGIHASPGLIDDLRARFFRNIDALADYLARSLGDSMPAGMRELLQARAQFRGMREVQLTPQQLAILEDIYHRARSQAPTWVPIPAMNFAGTPTQQAIVLAIPAAVVALVCAIIFVVSALIVSLILNELINWIRNYFRGPMPGFPDTTPDSTPAPPTTAPPSTPAPPTTAPPETPEPPTTAPPITDTAPPTTAPTTAPTTTTAPTPAPAPTGTTTSGPTVGPPPTIPSQIRLVLPPMKGSHLAHYQALVRERRLRHDITYTRTVQAQATRWDRGMQPQSGEGMYQEVYDRGVRLGLAENRIFRPNWTSAPVRMDMQVDHIVELQVTPAAEVALWDSFVNYELLDGPSNAASGSILMNNIQAERARLAATTGNPGWLVMPLVFTHVLVSAGTPGQRWSADEIRRGDHLDAYRRLIGERR